MRSRTVVLLVSFALMVLSLPGCGGGPAPAAPAPAENPSAADAGTSAVVTPASADAEAAKTAAGPTSARSAEPQGDAASAAESTLPTTRVLEPGKARRRVLRYAFSAKPEWLEMDLKMSMSMGMGGRPGNPVHIPTVRMWTRIEPKEVTPEGVRASFVTERVKVLDDVKVPAAMRAELEKEMGGLVGMKGSSRISTRGVASEVEFTVPPTVSDAVRKSMDSMRDAIRQMYVPLPEEEVGVGARWQVTSRMPLSGASMDVKMTYTLKELRADGMRADVDVNMSAPPKQPMKMATLPPGATAILDSLSGQGGGTVAPSFVRLAGEGTTNVSLASVFDISANGEHVHMVVNADTHVAARPSKGPPAQAAPAKTK